MYPVSNSSLSLLQIADYWSREIQPPASQNELLALLEAAWWLGEIKGNSELTRFQLLKKMFTLKRDLTGIVFITEEDGGLPVSVSLADGTAVVDLRPRVTVPSATDKWHEVTYEAAFEVLAKPSSFEHYPIISSGLDFIELTRDEFIQWLEARGFDFPKFWKGTVDPKVQLKPAPDPMINNAIREVYDVADSRREKPPNIKELSVPVLDRLRSKGYTTSARHIQTLGGKSEFKGRRRKVGKTLSSERDIPSS